MNIACSWSGGKDSCYALMRTLQNGHTLKAVVNMMNENGKISRSHGLPLSILEQQARAMQVPLIAEATSWNEYQLHFVQSLNRIRENFSVEAMVFGDIDLQQHRDWEEMVCSKANLQALLPLWKEERAALVQEMLDTGMDIMIVSCNNLMGERFLGERLNMVDGVSQVTTWGSPFAVRVRVDPEKLAARNIGIDEVALATLGNWTQ